MSAENTLQQLEVKRIKLSGLNPRRTFDPKALTELAESIKTHGVLEPLIVRPKGKNFELVAGERRLKAAKSAGLATVPVVVRDVGDNEVVELMLLENLQREDLKPFEEGRALVDLTNKVGLSQAEIGRRLGKSPGWISARLRMLELPVEFRDLYDGGKIGVEGLVMLVPYVQHDEFILRVYQEMQSHSYRDFHRASDIKTDLSAVFQIKSLAFQVSKAYWPPDWYEHVDLKECRKCSKKHKFTNQYGQEGAQWCLHIECFKPKVAAAKKVIRDVKEKEKVDAATGKAVINVQTRDRKSYRGLCKTMESYGLELRFTSPKCNKCPHKVKAKNNWGTGTICLKPSCWDAKTAAAKVETKRLMTLNSETIKDNMVAVLEARPEDLDARLLRHFISEIRLWSDEAKRLAYSPWFKKAPKGGYGKHLDKVPDVDLLTLAFRLIAAAGAAHAEKNRNRDGDLVALAPELFNGCSDIPEKIKVRD